MSGLYYVILHNIGHSVCASKTVGLVHYPTIIAPASGSVTVITQCADNAHRISSSMSVICTSSGSWSGTTPHCECDIGYHAVTVDGRQICQTQSKHFSIVLVDFSLPFLPYSCNCMSS